MSDTIEDLVRRVDDARADGDAERVVFLEAKIRKLTGGKPRKLSGLAKIEMPKMEALFRKIGEVEDFDKWNK